MEKGTFIVGGVDTEVQRIRKQRKKKGLFGRFAMGFGDSDFVDRYKAILKAFRSSQKQILDLVFFCLVSRRK